VPSAKKLIDAIRRQEELSAISVGIAKVTAGFLLDYCLHYYTVKKYKFQKMLADVYR
jgi:ABC-type tungstate transport system substrate-binding protein